jgi:hypothetical protein
VKQFVALEPGTVLKGLLDADLSFSGSKEAIDKKNYESINANGTANLTKMHYASKEYPEGLQLNTAQLKFSMQKLALSNLSGRFQKTNFSADGSLSNMIGYALHDELLTGSINMTADKINLNEWISTDTVTTSATTNTSNPFQCRRI